MQTEPGEPAAILDPLTDLFFTVAAVVLALIAVLVPSLHIARTVSTPPERVLERLRNAPAILVDERPAVLLIAGGTGLRLDGFDVPLDRIPGDAALRKILAEVARSGQPLVVAITPDGQESAFLLDAVAARVGIREMSQVRVDRFCGLARGSAGAALCRAESKP